MIVRHRDSARFAAAIAARTRSSVRGEPFSIERCAPIDRDLRVEVIILVPDDLEIDADDQPQAKILNDLRKSLQDLQEGRIYPIAELWDGIDV